MRVAVLTPLPPVRSGIAGYAALLLPHLAKRSEVVAVVDQDSWEPLAGVEVRRIGDVDLDAFDSVIGQLGNNPYHDFVWTEAMRRPIHVTLHDLVLHHLIFERTIAKGNFEEYEAMIERSDGPAGLAFARSRSRGFHTESGNFLFPASRELAAGSKGVIVHTRWAGEELRGRGVETPIVITGHPYDDAAPLPSAEERERIRRSLGFSPEDRVIGMFGFVTQAKRPESLFHAFGQARRIDGSLRLLVVGEPAPNVDLHALAAEAGLPEGSWIQTGYVADSEFDLHLAAVDRVVNLRYPSAGEMSGPLIHAFRLGRPVAVSELAQFAEIPREVVSHIPLTTDEIPALVSFLTRPIDAAALAAAQRAWLAEHGSIDRVVDGYMRALGGEDDLPDRIERAAVSLPLVPRLSLARLEAAGDAELVSVRFRIENLGEERYRAAVFGEPALWFVVKAWQGDVVVRARALPPTGDVGPGETVEMEVDLHVGGGAEEVSVEIVISEVPVVMPQVLGRAKVARIDRTGRGSSSPHAVRDPDRFR